MTDLDAREVVGSLRLSPLLAERIPEVTEMDCNPVVVTPTGAIAVDVKIRLAPVVPGPPPGLRRLR